MDEHAWARRVLQGAIAGAAARGAPASADELEQALAHISACDDCARHFDIAETAAWLESREESHEMANVPIDPETLFEGALTAALGDADAIVRERAAARLGGFDRLGAAALAALVAAARDDAEERVRAAALEALDRLDAEVSFSQRVIDAWAAAPAEAAPYLSDVLARLTGAGEPAPGVMRLGATQAAGEHDVVLAGVHDVSGRVGRERDQVWLTVENLPVAFENTKPVVAVPGALEQAWPQLSWAGEVPGLVDAPDPVAGHSLRVLLANVKEPVAKSPQVAARTAESGAKRANPFDQVFLLQPARRR
jgi:hypothetical protein